MRSFWFSLDGGLGALNLDGVIIPSSLSRRVLFLMSLGLLVRLAWAWLPEQYLFFLVSDDAYYYFTIARNLAIRGMFSADGITLTNGFHPLWLFVITPVFALLSAHHWLALHFALTFSAIFDLAAGFLIFKTLQQLGKENVGFWAAAFYLFNPYSLWLSLNGLETALNNFFLALLIYLSVSIKAGTLERGRLRYAAVCGLAFLSRTDNIFAVGVFLLLLLWRHKNFWAVAKISGLAALVAAPWLVYNYVVFGSLVQTSGTAYPFLNHDQYLIHYKTYFSKDLIPYVARLAFYDFAYNAFHYGFWILTVLIGAFLLFRLRNWPRETRLILWTLPAAGLFAAVHLFLRWSVRPWYAQAVYVLTLPAVALMFEKASRYWIAVGALIMLFLAGWRVKNEPFRIAERSYVIRDIIEKIIPPGDRVGVFNSGFVQYFTDRKVINLDGLVNNGVLAYYRAKLGLEYLREEKIGWVVEYQPYITSLFGPYWGPKAESTFVLIGAVPDIAFPGNTVYIVQVLPDSQRPVAGRRLKIAGLPARRSWEPIPIFLKF
jgi:hypothetical protein